MSFQNGQPEIIIFDLETIPNFQEILKVWPSVGQYPGKTLRATITTIICAGYKYLGEKQVHCLNVWDVKNFKINDDKRIVKALYDVLKTADAIVTHNGKRFDWKFLQTRLLFHGLPPLHHIPHIDTCSLAKSNIFSYNNRLGYIGEWLVDDKKMSHDGWDLWVKVYNGDKKAMKTMSDYCKQDVALTEKVFIPLRPFATNLPNFNLWFDDDKKVCPSCGSKKLKSHGLQHTKAKSYRRYRCRDCNSFSRVDLRGLSPRSVK